MESVRLPRRADAQVQVDLRRGGNAHTLSASPSARAQNCQATRLSSPKSARSPAPGFSVSSLADLFVPAAKTWVRLLRGKHTLSDLNRQQKSIDQSVGSSTLSFLSTGDASTCLLAFT